MTIATPPLCRICYAASTPPGTPPPKVEHYCQVHAARLGWKK